MTTAPFDALAYFEKLKATGFSEEQARVQANEFRDFSLLQDEKNRKELATKVDLRETEMRLQGDLRETEMRLQGDLRETEMRLQKEIEKVRAEIEKVRAEIQKNKYDLLKWQIGGFIAMGAIMAKGFGWLGF